MKNICFATAIIFLFSCKKNVESNSVIDANNIAGQWTSVYMGNSLQVTIGEDKKFSMELPVMVKKETGSRPETLVFRLHGICVQREGWYELQPDGFSVLNEGGKDELYRSILQSMTGVDFVVERADAAPLSFRVTSGSMLNKK